MADKNMMDWNDTIESDGQEFVLLDEGDYNFTVTNFERGRFPGGQGNDNGADKDGGRVDRSQV